MFRWRKIFLFVLFCSGSSSPLVLRVIEFVDTSSTFYCQRRYADKVHFCSRHPGKHTVKLCIRAYQTRAYQNHPSTMRP
ncbi:hypothetical protein C8Q75DRAFT_760318 [Abortiporus biennis]|nr:hypothetical protein C8Q75DRAFT_760318 [Abortiporus biennis]